MHSISRLQDLQRLTRVDTQREKTAHFLGAQAGEDARYSTERRSKILPRAGDQFHQTDISADQL
jgi:hypothetical protein